MGHIHAELMAQYAEDAKQHDRPWELWQHGDHGVWVGCSSNPGWFTDHAYRRKPQSTVVGEHVNAEIIRAVADGKKVQFRRTTQGKSTTWIGSWEDFDAKAEPCWNLLAPGKHQWRIVPETIMLGEYEVPEPCREVPEVGQKVWAIHPINRVEPFTWYGSKACHDTLESGFVLLTEEAAEKHYEAFKNLLAKK